MDRNKYEYKRINGVKNRVHRHVMEEHLKRPLESHEHVYHINANSKDNRIENLIIIIKKRRK